MLTPVAQFFENVRRAITDLEYKQIATCNFDVLDPETGKVETIASQYDSNHKRHFIMTADGRQFVGDELNDLCNVIDAYNKRNNRA